MQTLGKRSTHLRLHLYHLKCAALLLLTQPGVLRWHVVSLLAQAATELAVCCLDVQEAGCMSKGTGARVGSGQQQPTVFSRYVWSGWDELPAVNVGWRAGAHNPPVGVYALSCLVG